VSYDGHSKSILDLHEKVNTFSQFFLQHFAEEKYAPLCIDVDMSNAFDYAYHIYEHDLEIVY